ncbi:MAG: succinate--CoA ligase subunit alpha [Anaerolineaceae bacterium]|nr:succinate--CoA ligase subunit alpha [Anaerolineaceae bacterium]MDD4042020.1 succinate--CoA ligase subunit alpha [Anaerolineaceae bacterium]MDD4577568.1 succinate--CoA ligase subunit alpha [Anaerolineaceae bacterium]
MSILIGTESRIMVQGITGRRGRFHASQMFNSGSQIVGGTSPGKGGEWCYDGRLPVFDTVKDCVEATSANVSVIFVPPHSTADAILESIDCGVKIIISITGSIPLQDMMVVNSALQSSNSILVGPNSPGVLVPGIANAGIFPNEIAIPGNVGVVSRSGTLCYEVIDTLKQSGLGVSTAVGIGDDPIIGIDFLSCLELFEADPHTDQIVLVGGPGGDSEIRAATMIMESVTKPVIAYVVGENLATSILRPFFSRSGSLSLDSLGKKTSALKDVGVLMANKLSEIPLLIKR